MSLVTIANRTKKSFRKETLNGRPHIVVPTTLIVPGVLNGSGGPGFYSGIENNKSPQRWNHTPLVAPSHPQENGQHVSARDPKVLNKWGVGVVLNAHTNSDQELVGESWIDVQRADVIDPRILWKIRNSEDIEISTGLDLTRTEKEGTFNGQNYNWIASNYEPDHLAILTNEIGACSLKDGCGIHVNQLTFDQITSQLYMTLREFHNPMLNEDVRLWIEDVTSTFVVYHLGDRVMKVKYSKGNDVITLEDSPVEVKRKVTFVEVSNVADPSPSDPSGENAMDKKKLIDGIVNSGCDCWGEDDRTILDGFTEDKLQKIANSIAEGEKQGKVFNALKTGMSNDQVSISLNADETGIVFNAKKAQPAVAPTPASAKLTLDDMPEELKALVANQASQIDQQRKSKIEQIVNTKPEAERETLRNSLQNADLGMLDAMISLLPQKPAERRDFAGVGSVPTTNSGESQFSDGLTVPEFSFGGK